MSGRVALVTGASRGIGSAIAKYLAKDGYAVAVNYRSNKAAAEHEVAEILRAGGKAEAFCADVGNEQEVVGLFKAVKSTLGRVQVLVNNAGENGGFGAVAEITPERLESVFATHVFGTFYCCREALKHMQELGGGSIVNISSEAAKFGGRHLSHYASAKAAVNTFTIGFAREAAEFGVRVNAVSPAVIDTDQQKDITPERKAALLSSIPMGRMGTAEEVAEVVSWLCSDATSYVSGSIVPVTGAR